MFNLASGARGQQRGEKEVVTGGNDNDIVVLGIKFLQERDRAPSRTCKSP
jgi:hypothetical protein